MKSKKLWLSALGVAFLVGGYFALFESVEREVLRPPEREAQQNPWLAAERLLDRLGTPVLERRSLRKLPSTDSAILLIASREDPSEESRLQLLDWVADGGHLVVSPESDLLLEYLEIMTLPLEEAGLEEAGLEEAGLEEVELEEARLEEAPDVLVSARHDLPPRSLLLSEAPRFWHYGDTDTVGEIYQQGPPEANLLLRISYGSGHVTAFSDLSAFQNHRIGESEHAVFFWEMLSAPGIPTEIWRITADEIPSLFRLLYENAWTILLSATFWLLAFLWMRAARFGPTIDLPPPGRRSLREHLTASGYFLWRHALRNDGHAASLLEPLRAAVRRRYALRAMPENTARSLEAEVSEPAHFVAIVRNLHRILQDPNPR